MNEELFHIPYFSKDFFKNRWCASAQKWKALL